MRENLLSSAHRKRSLLPRRAQTPTAGRSSAPKRRPRGKALARNESVRRKNRVKLKVTAPSILMTGTRDESTALGDHSDLRLLPTECSRPWRENAPSEGSSVRGQPEKGMQSFVSSRKFRKKMWPSACYLIVLGCWSKRNQPEIIMNHSS